MIQPSPAQWHGTLFAICAILVLGVPESAAQPVQHPLKPPHMGSPRSTLVSFISVLERVQEMAGKPESQSDIASLARRALLTLDLSQLPPHVAEDRGIEAALMLKEVLARIALPPIDEIPGEAYLPTSIEKRPQQERACCQQAGHRRKRACSTEPKETHSSSQTAAPQAEAAGYLSA